MVLWGQVFGCKDKCASSLFFSSKYIKQISSASFKYQNYMHFIMESLQQPDKTTMEIISIMQMGNCLRDVE